MSSSREALVVGINNYGSSLSRGLSSYTGLAPLTVAIKDAQDIATLLDEYSYETIRIQTLPTELNLKGIDISKVEKSGIKAATLKKALKNLFNPPAPDKPQNMVLFFFSGHGWQQVVDGEKEVFLATSDVFPEKEDYGISLRWLGEQLQKSPVKKIVVFLDACYSGELFKYTENIEEEKDVCLITATRSNEPAIEQKYQNGLFTEKLLEALNPKDKPDGIGS